MYNNRNFGKQKIKQFKNQTYESIKLKKITDKLSIQIFTVKTSTS